MHPSSLLSWKRSPIKLNACPPLTVQATDIRFLHVLMPSGQLRGLGRASKLTRSAGADGGHKSWGWCLPPCVHLITAQTSRSRRGRQAIGQEFEHWKIKRLLHRLHNACLQPQQFCLQTGHSATIPLTHRPMERKQPKRGAFNF